ncbi:alpha/beta hydrolase fold domain-containing protein [Actinoplanes sp. NPDC089786]|uniref:alpha/beta hydrolase n=1 Tax=Actinoplanes sp. NPDC089786 TaxID=3155185 RepID=UPI003429F24E
MPTAPHSGRGITPHTRRIRVPGHPVAVPVRVLEPPGERAGWLVWAHGGSWRGGSARAWHHACAELAGVAGVTVVSVDYRLAPTHRHPAALLDVLTVLSFAQEAAAADGSTRPGAPTAAPARTSPPGSAALRLTTASRLSTARRRRRPT